MREWTIQPEKVCQLVMETGAFVYVIRKAKGWSKNIINPAYI